MNDTHKEKSSISVPLSRVLLAKIRSYVDSKPGAKVNIWIEKTLQKEIDAIEEEYGEIEAMADLYFDAPRRTKRSVL